MMNKLVTRLLLLALMTVAPLAASAQQAMTERGQIIQINNSMINLSDLAFPMLSTVKITLLDGKKGRVDDLKVGDYATISVIRIDKKEYVDSIELIKELPKPVTNYQEFLNVYKQGLHTN